MEAARQVDLLLATHWHANQLQPNPAVSDEVFVRRIYLDTVGRIPTRQEALAFLGSKQPGKRATLISGLLNSEGYVQHYFNYWADVLRVQSKTSGSPTGLAYAQFIQDSLRTNKPYDQFVRELTSAKGVAWENGAIGYYMRDRGMPLDNMAITARVFMGTRIECAQCHDHPFDKWSQLEFYKLAAFTYGVNEGDFYTRIGLTAVPQSRAKAAKEQAARDKMEAMEGVEKPDKMTVKEDSRGVFNVLKQIQSPFLSYTELTERKRDLKLPHDYKYDDAKPLSVVQPETIMGEHVTGPAGVGRTDVFAKWMTAPEHPRFTKVLVNRLWKKTFGLALIEPLDELTDTSKPMVPDLEAYLEKLLVAQHYDMKAFLGVLLNTRAYQSAVTRQEVAPGETYHFTGPVLRRMTAEQIWDSFVTLIRPDPDTKNLAAKAELEQKLNTARKINDAFQSIPPAELYDRAITASNSFREQSEKLKVLQQQLNAARAQKDSVLVRELSKQVSAFEAVTRQAVIDQVLSPMLAKLAEKSTGAPTLMADVALPAKEETRNGKGSLALTQFAKNTFVPGYDSPEKAPEQLAAERQARKQRLLAEAASSGVPEKERAKYVEYRERVGREWLRAAELDSPAPRGHFLRELGQSDREFVENGSSAASVPQALMLMNSQLVPQLLSRYSPLMSAVNQAPTSDDKLEAACLSLFSRKPTLRERGAWARALTGNLNTADDLVFALLNTKQFIFIQ